MMKNRVDMEGNIMAAIIGSPTRYIQGKGEMKNLCSYADKFGKNIFILTSASGRKSGVTRSNKWIPPSFFSFSD